MDFRACLAATLLAAAALMANAQPAGGRDPAALSSRADSTPPRKTYDFVIQKAEVRELSSSQLFLPPPPDARYGAPSPTYRLPPPPPLRLSAQPPPSPPPQRPVQPPRPLGSPAPPEAERLQKKQPSAKGKPTSKPRDDDTRRLLLGLSTPLTAANRAPASEWLAQGGYTYDKPGTAPSNRQVSTWQLPPYFPISTYASYAVPTYYNQQQQQQQQHHHHRQGQQHKGRISPDISSNSLGTEEDSKQGEVPSLLGLDGARRQEANGRTEGYEGRNERRGKSMNTDVSGTTRGGNRDNKSPNCCVVVSVEDLSSDERSRIESSEEVKATSGESASVESDYQRNAGYVLPRPGDKTPNSAIDAAVEAAKSAAEYNEQAGYAQSQQVAGGHNAAAVDAAKAAIGVEQGGGYVLPRPGDRQQNSAAINAAVEAAKVAAAGYGQGQGYGGDREQDSAAIEAAVEAAKVAAAKDIPSSSAGAGTGAGASVEAVEAAKAAIAAEASRAAAGELPAAAVAAAPGARLVTQLALRRRGGVAIAGPGGTAAAGAGGVAVVGPGGVAFARPNALSVVGPGGRVVALPAGAPEPRAGEALPLGARVVAVGPTVYLHPADAAAPPLPQLSFYKSPGWALFAPAPLRAAPPPPLPPLSALANLYTIINGRAVAAPAPYLNAYHHNLLNLQPHYSKPFTFAKVSAESPVKIFQPAPIPLSFQSLPRASAAETYQFPTNRPPPAVTTEPPATTHRPPTSTPEPESTSSEEVTTPTAPTTASTESSSSPLPTPADGKTVLILKPFAKAVAGINGTAVATPVGHAVYHKGQPVDVVFDPRAVAVAGPGGHARAHSDLIVSYIEKE